MNITEIFEELKNRGEKIKQEVLNELVQSKTLNRIVTSESFVRALTTLISTKSEIQKALSKQIKSLIKTMEVVTHSDLSSLLKQLKNLEAGIAQLVKLDFFDEPKKSTSRKKKAQSVKQKAKTKKPAKAVSKKKSKASRKK